MPDFVPHKNWNVLVVEDSPDVSRYYMTTLGGMFNLTPARDLRSAVDAIGCNKFHCVLLDLNLPNGKGTAVVKTVHDRDPDLPIVVVTGMAEVAAEDAIMAGADDVLRKPECSPRIIHRAVVEAVARAEARRAFAPIRSALEEVKVTAKQAQANLERHRS